MELTDYIKKRDAGNATVSLSADGKYLLSESEPVDIEHLRKTLTVLEANITNLKALLADLELAGPHGQ